MTRRLHHLALAAACLLAGAAAAAAQSADPMVRGLEQRGLKTLLDVYRREFGETTAPPPAVPGDVDVPAAGGQAAARAAAERQAAMRTRELPARNAHFEAAKTLYQAAIDAAAQVARETPQDQWEAKNTARMDVLKLRMDLGNMIFQEWLQHDLDLLELTDRRVGNRQRAAELLKVALDQFSTALLAASQWLSEIDLDPDRSRFVNAGYVRNLQSLRREAEYKTAWITYYRGWVLPKSYEPAEGERGRTALLNDAITGFVGYTDLPDTVPAKWWAHLVVGLAHRELGQYEEALNSFAQSGSADAPKPLKIRSAFEKARTYLAQGAYGRSRETLQDARQFFGAKVVEDTLFGLGFPIVEAESYVMEGRAAKDEATKDKGVQILRGLYGRADPWPTIVEAVMFDLVGGTVDEADQMEPFQLWMAANEALEKAQESKTPADFEEALRLFTLYTGKVEKTAENYPQGLYTQAAIRFQLGRKTEAAELFRQVAGQFPDFQHADAAAQYAVSLTGEHYDETKTEEARNAYETALRWYLNTYPEEGESQRYYLGVVLFNGKHFTEAAEVFAQIGRDSPFYPDARYWVPLCHLEQFREQVLPTKDKQLILSRARSVAKLFVEFAEYAQKARLPEEKQAEVQNWIQAAYLNAAEVHLYPEVDLPDDALKYLEQMEAAVAVGDEMRGRVLKLRIDALQKLRRFDEAQRLLEDFLALAMKQGKQEEIGRVLGGLFQAMIDDVRQLVKRDKAAAAAKVEAAEKLSQRLIEWLQKNGGPEGAIRIEVIRYDLADLFLAVSEYQQALNIFMALGGPKPEEPPEGEPLKIDCIEGMARAYQGLGETAPDRGAARPHFERAVELWRVARDVADADRDTPKTRIDQFQYNLFLCKFKAGQVAETRDALKAMEIMRNGKFSEDPVIQRKFRELLGQAQAAAPAAAGPVGEADEQEAEGEEEEEAPAPAG